MQKILGLMHLLLTKVLLNTPKSYIKKKRMTFLNDYKVTEIYEKLKNIR